MAQATVLALGTTAARSSDIVVTTTPVTVSAFLTAGGRLDTGAQLAVERKVNGNWQPVTDREKKSSVFLSRDDQEVTLTAPGTYSVYRYACPVAVGVATDTTA